VVAFILRVLWSTQVCQQRAGFVRNEEGGHVGAAARTWHPKDVLPCSELDNLFYFFLKLGRAPAAHVDGPRHWPNKAKQGGQLDTLQLYLQGTARTTGLRAIKRPSHNHVACIACEVFSQICVL